VKYARQKSPETELYVITNGSYVNEDIADAFVIAFICNFKSYFWIF